MLEFIRVFRNNELKVLNSLKLTPLNRDYGDGIYFYRRQGWNLENLIELLNHQKDLSRKLGFQDWNYYNKAINALETIVNFMKGKSDNSSLVKSTQDFIDEVIDYKHNFDSYYFLENILKLCDYIQKNKSQTDILEFNNQKESFRKAIRLVINPRYHFLEDPCDMSSTTIERIVRGLQGIVSIKASNHSYRDLWIPRHVFEESVVPALEDSQHQFIRKVKDGELKDILSFIHHRTLELRNKYGKDFRPEFTRVEIIREVGLKNKPLNIFNKLMEPLEGILSRIERKDMFEGGELSTGRGYWIYYEKPTWFLSLRHQYLLEA